MTVQIGFASAKAFAGQEVGFFAHFALQPGWHIYDSPLPESYTATSITFEDVSVLEQKLELPEPEILDILVLEEMLPVYTGSVNGIGSLLLKHPLPEGPLKLHGRIEFQQCSDRVCEPPQTIPFELALNLEPFTISEREKKLKESAQ
ncbi:MAG TPA: protein-disulfide reductase DsbD domain-containing protein [Bryobacteraceae bacterium]|nr:protein-disulfide reductase DsbD domain-containing protein [Bryobacteraceae bacterium]